LVFSLEIETLCEGVAKVPGKPQCDTATTQQYNRDNGNDQDCVVVLLLGLFFNDRGHFVHDFFSL
jgi:hypothetical protein